MNTGILVLVEHLKGSVADISFEILGAGRKIADTLQVPLYAVVLAKDATPLTGSLGVANAIVVVEDPAFEMASPEGAVPVLKQIMEQKQAGLLLLGGTNVSLGIGSQLSAAAHVPFVNFCKDIRVENSELRLTTTLFGGKILADVTLPEGRGVISLSPGSFPADAGRSHKAPVVEKHTFPTAPARILFKRIIEPAAGDIDITKKDILVSVGRGIQNQDNIAQAEELAAVLNGAVSSSRPVVDQGWLPLTRQVGKSGMSVAPKLYLALGISGAPEHWEGMKNAALIIAINTDPKAPIFDFAHYGANVDLFELIEPLKAALEAKKTVK